MRSQGYHQTSFPSPGHSLSEDWAECTLHQVKSSHVHAALMDGCSQHLDGRSVVYVLVLPEYSRRSCRDIKLENTLLDGAMPRPNVKLCDFGYSKNEFVDSRPKSVSGTTDYIAPEVCFVLHLPLLNPKP